MYLNSPITVIKGIGEVKKKQFEKLGILTVRDLLYHFPRAYQNRGEITALSAAVSGEVHSFALTVSSAPKSALLRRGLTITKFKAFDDSGSAEIIFFNQPYIKDVFLIGDTFRFYGKAEIKKGKASLTSPEYEKFNGFSPLPDYISIYPLTYGITRKGLDKAIKEALKAVITEISDPMPQSILKENSLPSLQYALASIHFPESREDMERAIRRLAFDEYFEFALGMAISRKNVSDKTAPAIKAPDYSPLFANIPYELTTAQKRSCKEIISDMSSGKAMKRILMGDVGSGKTVCAAIASYAAIKNGGQVAVMVPTEILAHQHFEEFSKLYANTGIKIHLLLGSTKSAERRQIYKEISSGECNLIIGTHALLSDKVQFSHLLLTVTDEQHRFGVMQRTSLFEKNSASHLLVMSATPIPRTLALSMYGDLEISKIDEMPAGRQRVETYLVDEAYRTRTNEFIRKTVNDGGQAYIVCPSIEETQKEENIIPLDEFFSPITAPYASLKNATDLYTELQTQVFPEFKIGLLHGKMPPSEKEAVMHAFERNEINILVSTTVVEVGVNVPNASLMIIENAERYGLSTLHQLRGRVGRGKRKSYCILVSETRGEIARERLKTLTLVYDGYKIAEKDLALRGPGDFFTNIYGNVRQSGGFNFKLSSLCKDSSVMEAAFKSAFSLVKNGSIPKELLNNITAMFSINENTIS